MEDQDKKNAPEADEIATVHAMDKFVIKDVTDATEKEILNKRG